MTLTSIIIVIVAGIAGYLFGLLDGRVTSTIQNNMAERKEKESQPVEIVVEKTALSVYQDEAQGLRVKLYGSFLDIPTMTPEQRSQLVNLLVKLRPWVDGKTAPAPSPAPAPAAPPISAPAPVLPSRDIPPIPLIQSKEAETPRLDVLRGARTFLQNAMAPTKEEPALSTLAAILNTYLKNKLAGTPMESMQISLKDGPMGEVMVAVGLKTYPSIDEVPDPNIQAVIRQAIAEWNASK